MATRTKNMWLRLRSIVIMGLLGLMGMAFTGCPPAVVMYGPPVPEYGAPAAKAAPAQEQAVSEEAPRTHAE